MTAWIAADIGGAEEIQAVVRLTPSTTSSTTTLPRSNQRVLILGVGALGSNIAVNLLADVLPIDLEIMDYDKVANRNVFAGTQFYFREQIGMPKVEALQYNLYKFTGKECRIHNGKFTKADYPWLDRFRLIIDALDNYDGRKAVYDFCRLNTNIPEVNSMRMRSVEGLHVGFSQHKTFEVTWNENYRVPEEGQTEFDICEMRGARSFINHASGVASSIIKDFITDRVKKEAIGNAYTSRLIV